jgi:hypothetical protein
MRIKERRTKPHTKGTSGKCKKKKKIRSEYLSLISANQVDQRVQDNQQVYKVLAYSLGTPPMTLVFFSTIPFLGVFFYQRMASPLVGSTSFGSIPSEVVPCAYH